MQRVGIITLGCSKNLVDSERLMGWLEKVGFEAVPESSDEPIVVVNTCGFIGDAKQESINTILELEQKKAEGKIKHIYVMGCLSQRYGKELQTEIPGIDKCFGKFDWDGIVKELTTEEHNRQGASEYGYAKRKLTTPPHYAYIKIAEGCDRHCAYCAIPIMTGKHVSRPQEEILEEVRELVARGVKEFQIIAQEITFYGKDIDGKFHIAELIDRMADIKGVEWIRLHYAYPTDFPMELLEVMRKRENVCKYLDIALQHISENVLKRMHRHVTKGETYDLIRKIRQEVPGITLRTTLMVGFPGETEEDFEELLTFVKEMRFERMGAFTYSEEEGTFAAQHYKDDVPESVKQTRLDRLMAVQQDISAEMEAEKVGQTAKVIIDANEGEYYIGRTENSSPEVDPEVLIPNTKHLTIGEFYQVKITDAEEFDLYGEVITTHNKNK